MYKLLIYLTLAFFSCDVVSQDNKIKEILPESTKLFKPEFPIITALSNLELYEGNSDEIKSHIEKRKSLIDSFSAQLKKQKTDFVIQIDVENEQLERDKNQQVLENLANKERNKKIINLQQKQEAIVDLINNFKDVHFKHVSLLQELDNKSAVETPLAIEEPYTVKSLEHLNDYIQKLHAQQKSSRLLIVQSNKRVRNLKDLLGDFIVRYTIALNDNKDSFKLYDLLRTTYLYQADFAILQLKKTKYEKKLDYVASELIDKEGLFPRVLDKLEINEDTIQEIKQKVESLKEDSAKLLKEHEKLNKGFDKSSLESELALENLEEKIKNNTDEASVESLQLQKQINLQEIQYVYYIKNLLQQKQLTLQLQQSNEEFQSDWVQSYQKKELQSEAFKKMVKKWQVKLESQKYLSDENKQLFESLNRSEIEVGRLMLQAIKTNKSSNKINKLKNQLDKQLRKNQKTIQRLSLELTHNNDYNTTSLQKNNRILDMLSKQLNKLDQIGQWFGDKFNTQFEKVKKVIYYPLTSFGETAFTLAVLIKIILYLILGFMFLLFIRKRLTVFLSKRTKLSEGASHSIATLIYYLGGFLVFLLSLSAAGFNFGELIIVFGALGVGIGFGLQNIANNFISGMILLIDRTLTVGDSISLNDGTNGKVVKLAMRYTVIRTNGGYDIIVPNSELISNRVTSMTFDDNYLRIDIPFGVSYDSDPAQVSEITLAVANNVKHTINRESQKSAVLFTGFGDSSLDFVLRVWVFIYDKYRPYAIRSDYYFKLFKAFKEAGIEIPFPQSDINVKGVHKEISLKVNPPQSTED